MKQYRQADDVETAPMRDETLLYSPASNKFYVLNETAAFLWDVLQVPCSEDLLLEKLCASFEVEDVTVATEEVRQTLQQFSELRMVASSD
jgi:PqqD family protein of HPr-rel-A system